MSKSGSGYPVVHLGIDVDGVLAVPRGIPLVVPYTLQIGRLTSRLRRRYEQITAILEHQSHHIHIAAALESSQPLVRLQIGVFRLGQAEANTIVLLLIL